jgi:hypothetical protein
MSFVFSSGNSDIYSHIGGFIAGMACGLFLSPIYVAPNSNNQVTLSQFSYRKEEKIMIYVGVASYLLMISLMWLLM